MLHNTFSALHSNAKCIWLVNQFQGSAFSEHDWERRLCPPYSNCMQPRCHAVCELAGLNMLYFAPMAAMQKPHHSVERPAECLLWAGCDQSLSD